MASALFYVMPKYGIQLWDCFSAIGYLLCSHFWPFCSSVGPPQGREKGKTEIQASVCFENDSDGLNHIVNGCAEEAKTKGPLWVLLGCSLSALATSFVNQKV